LKMCVNEFNIEQGYAFHISNLASLAVIIGLLATSILFSIAVKKRAELKELRRKKKADSLKS